MSILYILILNLAALPPSLPSPRTPYCCGRRRRPPCIRRARIRMRTNWDHGISSLVKVLCQRHCIYDLFISRRRRPPCVRRTRIRMCTNWDHGISSLVQVLCQRHCISNLFISSPKHAYKRKWIHTNMQTCTCTHVHADIHTKILEDNTYIYMYTNTSTYIHAYCAYTHTHTDIFQILKKVCPGHMHTHRAHTIIHI